MATYKTYVEADALGNTMIHVLSLPGCFARGANRRDALSDLPQAIRSYDGWLRVHGNSSEPLPERIEIAVIEEVFGVGPFDPGDSAALFSPEREPIDLNEIEDWFQLIGFSRDDLLELVASLPQRVLDLSAGTDSFTIRRILRHIGNAEEWYVSRLVDPNTLPPEWDGDDAMPLFEFLEMERRTALDRLRLLSETERSNVFSPDRWTDHPDEQWTARKTLRRFLEL